MVTYVYYHDNLDGNAAAYFVYKDLALNNHQVMSYYPTMPEDKKKFSYHSKNDCIVIIGLPFNTFEELKDVCSNAYCVVIIDHHTSTASMICDHYEELPQNLEWVVSTNASSCTLSYLVYDKYIEAKDIEDELDVKTSTTKPFPTWVNLIDNNECTGYDNMFTLGCIMFDTNLVANKGDAIPTRRFWDYVDGVLSEGGHSAARFIDEIMNTGKCVHKIKEMRMKKDASNIMEVTLNGVTFDAKNTIGDYTDFRSLNLKNRPCMIFNYSGNLKQWVYQIYWYNLDDEFDCGKFAEQFGGNGTRHYAKFQSEKLLLDI